MGRIPVGRCARPCVGAAIKSRCVETNLGLQAIANKLKDRHKWRVRNADPFAAAEV